MEPKAKLNLKMHHVLILTILIFLVLSVFLSLFKSFQKSANDFKSNYMPNDILTKLSESSKERMFDHKLSLVNDLAVKEIGPVSLAVFKKEKELQIWIPKHKIKAKFKLQDVSSGYGIKLRPFQSVFPEGIYGIDEVGLSDKKGYFIELVYPTKLHIQDQRIKKESFASDALLISHEKAFTSYITLSEQDVEDLCYLVLKLGKENVTVLVYPNKPPIKMDLTGTYVLAEIFKELEQRYKTFQKVMNE